MMPVARLALLRAYPRSELLPVLNFVTMPGLVGPVLGPVLGGVLVTWASWHWIFLINIPIGIAGLLYARKYMPNFTTPRHGFDMGGFLLFGLSLVLFSSGMELFGEKIVETWIVGVVIASGLALLWPLISSMLAVIPIRSLRCRCLRLVPFLSASRAISRRGLAPAAYRF